LKLGQYSKLHAYTLNKVPLVMNDLWSTTVDTDWNERGKQRSRQTLGNIYDKRDELNLSLVRNKIGLRSDWLCFQHTYGFEARVP